MCLWITWHLVHDPFVIQQGRVSPRVLIFPPRWCRVLLALESGVLGKDLEFWRATRAAGAEGIAYWDLTSSGGPPNVFGSGKPRDPMDNLVGRGVRQDLLELESPSGRWFYIRTQKRRVRGGREGRPWRRGRRRGDWGLQWTSPLQRKKTASLERYNQNTSNRLVQIQTKERSRGGFGIFIKNIMINA